MTKLLLLATSKGCDVSFSPNGEFVDVSVSDDSGREVQHTIETARCSDFMSNELELLVATCLMKIGAADKSETVAAMLP